MSGFRVNTAGQFNQGHFSKVPATINAPRSSFDRSFKHSTTVDTGLIYPLIWEPLIPGDTVNMTVNLLARLATPIFPYMDNLYCDVHAFVVPRRLTWTNWEKFQGAQENPGDSVDYEMPSLSQVTHSAGFGELSIYDYFGLPTKEAFASQADMPIAAPFRAYNQIINYWYRDENLQNSLPIALGDAPDTTTYSLFRRNRRKDYFTSATPWPQKGPSVQLPLGSFAPIISTNGDIRLHTQNAPTVGYNFAALGSDGHTYLQSYGAGDNYKVGFHDPVPLQADLSDATAATVNEWREAIVLQQMLELDARSGTRYTEAVLARFGVTLPDFRANRPEYIGGQTFDVNVSPVAQTSESADSPQGNLAGFAVARGKAAINYSAVEHCDLLVLLSFRADTTYQQGMNRHWSVRTRYDIYEPMSANLGEQAILNKELVFNSSAAGGNNGVFGYQERWAEYRYKPGMVTGRFRSNATGTLDSWHLAVDLPDDTDLADLIPENPPVDRIIAVTDEPQFIVDSWTRFRHVRIMPIYSKPGLTRL